jgi:hypothetical protein
MNKTRSVDNEKYKERSIVATERRPEQKGTSINKFGREREGDVGL